MILALAWPLFLVLQEGPPRQETPVPSQVLACVLRVRSRRGGNLVYQGSGLVIARGLVATNAPVTEGTRGLSVQQGPINWPASQVRVDRARDSCLLAVPGLTAPAALPA